ncbi:MAG TPA: GxxExxY protein, partial [Chloroflexi bacterium]|nr:GxxExxY protein [Chloroflexota bacterium]
HRALGPGLLKSAYEACLAFELVERGLKAEQQKPLPVVYREVNSFPDSLRSLRAQR